MLHVCTDKRHATATRNAPQRGRSTKRALAELSSISDLRAYALTRSTSHTFCGWLMRMCGDFDCTPIGHLRKIALILTLA